MVYSNEYGVPTTHYLNPALEDNSWQQGLLQGVSHYIKDSSGNSIFKKVESPGFTLIPENIGEALVSNSNYQSYYLSQGVLKNDYTYTRFPVKSGYILQSGASTMLKEDDYVGAVGSGVGNTFKTQPLHYSSKKSDLPYLTNIYSQGSNNVYKLQTYTEDYFPATYAEAQILPNILPVQYRLPVETVTVERINYGSVGKVISARLNNYTPSGQLKAIYSFHNDTVMLFKDSFQFSHKTVPVDFDNNFPLFPKYNMAAPGYLPNPNYKKDIEFFYDSSFVGSDYIFSNLIEKRPENGLVESYIWGYSPPTLGKTNRYLVAKIIGAKHADAAILIDQNLINNAGNYSDAVVRSELNKIRQGLPNAYVTTYTYKELVGITSETDPKGNTIFYEYDSAGRLKLVKDKDGNIIKYIEQKLNHK